MRERPVRVERNKSQRYCSGRCGLFRTSVARNIELTITTNPDLPRIKADQGQIQQVAMNLIINAAEAIGAGHGVITITTGVLDCDDEYLSRSLVEEKPSSGRFVTWKCRTTVAASMMIHCYVSLNPSIRPSSRAGTWDVGCAGNCTGPWRGYHVGERNGAGFRLPYLVSRDNGEAEARAQEVRAAAGIGRECRG